MKATIEDLKNSFDVGYYAFEDSRKEASRVWDLYHNRHYTSEQLAVLENRGQPPETFNVIKLFARMLVGYYSTVVNTVVVLPENPRDITTATVLNDAINHVFSQNRFDIEGDQIKLGGLVSGLLCAYSNVENTGKKDEFGRPIRKVVSHHIPDYELVLDPMSVLDDYSDARFLHRFRWVSKDALAKLVGKEAVEKLDAYSNHLNVDEADFEYNYGFEYTGTYRIFDNYLIVHSVMEDEEGERWSCLWSGSTMLIKEKITFQEAKWPYRVQKVHSSNKKEYYGIFREVIESQNAINQALLKLQLLVNSEKAFVEQGAVKNIAEFTRAFNRVNGVIPVVKLSGIKVENLTREVLDQYTILDKSLDRIQRILGINDSFLGMAYASDSGRKVKLQQSATIMSLRYITARIESFYQSLGWDIANLIKQYYTANQIIRITDANTGTRWAELNKPMMKPTGRMGQDGQPEMQPILLPETNPANGEIMEDEEGNIILAPISEEDTEIAFTEFEIAIESNSYNDEDEKAQLMLETVMSGQIGQMAAQINPVGFFQMSALAIKGMKTKYTPEIVKILEQTAQQLSQTPGGPEQASQVAQGGGMGQQPGSKALKLPQNTNEGV